MARKIPTKNGGFLLALEKGECGNPNGRPRKIVSKLKLKGYKGEEIKDTLCKLLVLTKEELKDLKGHKDINSLETICLEAIAKCMKKGSTDILDYLISKKSSKDEESTDKLDASIKMPEDAVEASKKYQELMKDG